jgi:dTMP kinase
VSGHVKTNRVLTDIPEQLLENRGIFITLEGPDGSGKSTQADLLAGRLEAEGLKVTRTFEPGGTGIGKRLREIILDNRSVGMCGITEFLLYAADRAQDVHEVIVPALRGGRIVVAERFVDSSIAYQGHGLGMDIDEVKAVNHIATRGLVPDLTLLLDIDPALGVRRATDCHEADRIEQRRLDFHLAVREAYLMLAADEPERFTIIEVGNRSIPEVHEEIYNAVTKLLKMHMRGD